MKNGLKKVALCATLLLNATSILASLPQSISIGETNYIQTSTNPIGNHKISEYIPRGETLNNWTTYVAIHQFVSASDPSEFAKNQLGSNITITSISGDKNNIIVLANTMNTVNDGDTVIYQQNAWHYQQFSLGRGIMAVQYSKRTVLPNQSNISGIEGINPSIVDEIKTLPLNSYQF